MRSMSGNRRRMYLFGRLVQEASDVGDERGALLGIRDSADQNHEHKGTRSENDSGVMMNFGDFAGLVRDAGSGWQARRDSFFEGLALEDFDHLSGRVLVHGVSVCDSFE